MFAVLLLTPKLYLLLLRSSRRTRIWFSWSLCPAHTFASELQDTAKEPGFCASVDKFRWNFAIDSYPLP